MKKKMEEAEFQAAMAEVTTESNVADPMQENVDWEDIFIQEMDLVHDDGRVNGTTMNRSGDAKTHIASTSMDEVTFVENMMDNDVVKNTARLNENMHKEIQKRGLPVIKELATFHTT